MSMNINEKLNELFDLLDKHEDIQKVQKLKKCITDKELALIKEYRDNPTVLKKKELYDNEIIDSYLKSETSVNYLIMEMNKRFKRSKSCENHKW